MSYELHPLCTLFPRVTGADFDNLVADIKAHGLRQPIVLHQGMVLDGGNRYRACEAANVKPHFVEFDGENIVSFVLSANLHRRHMTAGQQAAIVAAAQDWAKAQPAHRPEKAGNVAGLSTVAARAAQSGAGERTQRMADKVAKADPALARKVAHGEVSLPKAVAQVENKPPKAKLAAILAPSGDTEVEDLRESVQTLVEENRRLSDRLAVEAMDYSEDEKTLASQTIAELRAEVQNLKRERDAIAAMRDALMNENAELKRTIKAYQRQRVA